MREWLRRWLMGTPDMRPRISLGAPDEPEEKIKPHVRVGTMEVMNGKLLEVTTYKQNPRGPDWTTTYWIMDDRPLAEQIATVLVMKGLDK